MKRKLLLLTLVHPDFLPPVYAIAQVLRDEGYQIHILTFESFVPAELNLGPDILIETIGKHHEVGTSERIKLRMHFLKRAQAISYDHIDGIIAFCPFSFNCAVRIGGNKPVIYHALEISDFVFSDFLRSPLSSFRNFKTFRQVHKADLLATPSHQRSAWLAGRCQLEFMPVTVLNTSYLPKEEPERHVEIFNELIPEDMAHRKVVLYTGAINSQQCTKELVQAFDMVGDPESVLVITGMRDTEYCQEVRQVAERSGSAARIILFPYVTRQQMLALQANAAIGVYLTREFDNKIQSKMIAPNKVGEYLAKGLYLLGIDNQYLKAHEMKGIASLSRSAEPTDIAAALRNALKSVSDTDYTLRIKEFVSEYFCMQHQLTPVIDFLKERFSEIQTGGKK